MSKGKIKGIDALTWPDEEEAIDISFYNEVQQFLSTIVMVHIQKWLIYTFSNKIKNKF